MRAAGVSPVPVLAREDPRCRWPTAALGRSTTWVTSTDGRSGAQSDIDRNLDRHRGLADVTKQLVELFDRHRLPATWAVGDPAHSAAAALVTLSETQHELALLGDHHWIGPTAGRTRFARELARRVSQARTAGIEIGDARAARRADCRAHRPGREARHSRGRRARPARVATDRTTRGPRALHYGVWEFSATEQLPLRSSWLPGGGWKLYRTIRRAASKRRRSTW